MTKNESASRLASKALGLDMTAAMIRAVPDIQTQIEPLGVGTSIGAITVNISVGITTVVLPLLTMHMLYDVRCGTVV